MIPKIFFILCYGLFVSLLVAGEEAYVVGPVADGTPPPPAPPLSKLKVSPEDVLEATVRDLGNRKITIQRVTPIKLPPLAKSPEPRESTAEERAAWETRRQQAKRTVLVMMSVTVFRSKAFTGQVRTKFRWWSEDHSNEYEAWSNVDANWLSGFAYFDSANTRYSLFFGLGNQDLDRWADACARRGVAFTPPAVPPLQEGELNYIVTKGAPTAEELAPIVALHSLVKTDGEKLRLAYEGRQRAQREQEAFLKAHPPTPTDIVLNYWRVEKPAAASKTLDGGSHE